MIKKFTPQHFINNPFVPYKFVHNELEPALLGICAMNPLVGQVSATRLQMYATHLGQAPSIVGASEAFLQTAMERKFGTATFNIRAETDLRVLKKLQLYPRTGGSDSIAYNPEEYVLYEETKTGHIGIMTIPKYMSNHPYFGFPLKPFSAAGRLHSDGIINAGEVLYDVPGRDEDGTYKTGRETLVAFMSHPAVADDGLGVSSAVIDQFGFYIYERRTVAFGNKSVALNIYGDDKKFKICPDIGEYVREDGMLMAVREYNDILAGCEQSVQAYQRVDDITDIPTYVDAGTGKWRGRVIDIRVLHDKNVTNAGAPVGTTTQLEKYNNARLKFSQDLIAAVDEIQANRRKSFVATPELHAMLESATAATIVEANGKVDMLNAQKPLDAWEVSFVIEYFKVPGLAAKFTGHCGDKGVMVVEIPEEHMPVDSAGNRAEMIFDPGSTSNRQNPARMDMHLINSYRDYLRKWVCSELGYKPGATVTARQIRNIYEKSPDLCRAVWKKVLRFYEIVAPVMAMPFLMDFNDEDNMTHLAYVIRKNMYLQIPTNNERESFDRCEMLEREFDRINGPVTYTGYSGEQCTTIDNVVVAHLNVMLLEKVGDDWSAVSSVRTQVHGVVSQVTRADKYRYAVRLQAPRFLGEGELRSVTANTGPIEGAKMLNRNNNPNAHKAVVNKIVSSDQATNIQTLLEGEDAIIDGSHALKNIKHVFAVAGWGLAYKPYENVHMKPVGWGVGRDIVVSQSIR